MNVGLTLHFTEKKRKTNALVAVEAINYTKFPNVGEEYYHKQENLINEAGGKNINRLISSCFQLQQTRPRTLLGFLSLYSKTSI